MDYKFVILDAGHGVDTDGKRSPVWSDGAQLLEYEFNKNIVERIRVKLWKRGIVAVILIPEDIDISLAERCRRANRLFDTHGDCFLVSIHANAGGGQGFEIYTSKGQTPADEIATTIYREMERHYNGFIRMRPDMSDGDPDKEADFYILRHTKMPAVLSENLFMDNERECRYLMSEKGRDTIAEVHANAIEKIIKAKANIN